MYQGLQISGILYDEVTHAEPEDIWWLISRLRSKAKNNPSIWLTCNPEADTWLLDYVMPYLLPIGDENAGRPDPEKNGMVRWLLRVDGEIVWGDSKEDLQARYGLDKQPRSFKAIFGTVDDNPVLLKNAPEYKANLESLPHVECERLRWGNWFVRPEASGFFKRDWVTEINEPPPKQDIVKIVRAWDLAGELASAAVPSPDFSVGVKMAKLKNGNYVILDVIRFRARFGDLVQKITKIAIEDGTDVEVLIPQDPNASAKAACKQLVQQVIEGSGARAKATPTNKSKIDRFRPFSASAQNGVIQVLKNCCTCLETKQYGNNNFFYGELEKFDGGRKGHDDCCDSVSDAFMRLAQSKNIPNFMHGLKQMNLSTPNPINNIPFG